ncbi:hypothetical protein Trydic_g10018, partial [Trypoxylus dichotomus]
MFSYSLSSRQQNSGIVYIFNYGQLKLALKETVQQVEQQGGKAYAYKCDITNREDVYKTAERTVREVGQ